MTEISNSDLIAATEEIAMQSHQYNEVIVQVVLQMVANRLKKLRAPRFPS